MEPGFVPTRAEEFVIFVDERAGLGPHAFEDLQAFLVAEEAVVCPECFNSAEGIALPQHMHIVEGPNVFGFRGGWISKGYSSKVLGKCVGVVGFGAFPMLLFVKEAHLAYMCLHSMLEVVLGASNVGFGRGCRREGLLAAGFIHNNGFAAVVIVVTPMLSVVDTVALKGLKVKKGYNFSIDLCS